MRTNARPLLPETTPGHGRRPLPRALGISLALLISGALAACGGGGGDASATAQGGSGGGSGGGGSGGTTSAPVAGTAQSFYFRALSSLAQSSNLEALTGGSTFAAWNPADAVNSGRPGMKVSFFGAATGCASTVNGVVGAGDATRFAQDTSLSGVDLPADLSLRWTPQGDTSGCASGVQADSGDSIVALQPRDSGGAMAMVTYTGPRADGTPAFFGPYGAAGQNGRGGNAFINGSYVAFRQDWRSTSPRTPWATNGTARVYSVQSIASTAGTSTDLGATVVQAKQEVLASFINPTCVSEAAAAGQKRSCQVQYLLPTGIYRSGVTDWSTVGWFNAGKVWFDAVQGGATIVEGPVRTAGAITTDATSGLALFSSAGQATRHDQFANQAFDVRITFAQLGNAMRLAAAKSLGVSAPSVTDAQVADLFGSRWNDPTAWATMSTSVGQEVYNPDATWRAWIGGSFASLYVGPAA